MKPNFWSPEYIYRIKFSRVLPILIAFTVALLFTIFLVLLSLGGSLYSGPSIRAEVLSAYLPYSIYALTRLAAWVFLISFLLAGVGSLCYTSLVALRKSRHSILLNTAFAFFAIFAVTSLQFCSQLFHIPSSIAASFNYDIRRLYPLWEMLSEKRIFFAWLLLLALLITPVLIKIFQDIRSHQWKSPIILSSVICFYIAIVVGATFSPNPEPGKFSARYSSPNIIMIGSDTLRADRLGVNGNPRTLTPAIDALARQGTNFTQNIVTLARTAPSMVSMMTSTWPSTHGVRDNFVTDAQRKLTVTSLPAVLKRSGYVTEAMGDWAASDLGKFDFGYDRIDVAPDQWNFKYLLRQGPKNIRLFLSLFTHNRFGKNFLPEIYYLAGVPLTSEVTRDARWQINSLAKTGKPFFLNIFIASTHGPFGSAYPYYRLYANPTYRGKSLFTMSDVSTVEEIIRSQQSGKQHFDVTQLFDLYDGAVRSFDDAVGSLRAYLRDTGLDKNTIIVIYSDHGVDLFESETWGQGNILSDYSYHTPLVIYDPRQVFRVHVVGETVRSVDIAPTLLDLAGIPQPQEWEGASMLPLMQNHPDPNERIAFAETGVWIAKVRGLPKDRIPYPSILELLEIKNKDTGTLSFKPEYLPTLVKAKERMARQGQWALIYLPTNSGATYSLYNLSNDLAMKNDVSALHPKVTTQLRAALNGWMKGEAQ